MRQLNAECEQATARSVVATAAVHVARAEERSATLQRVIADCTEQIQAASELASETERLVNEHEQTEGETSGDNEAHEMKTGEQHDTDAAADDADDMLNQQ